MIKTILFILSISTYLFVFSAMAYASNINFIQKPSTLLSYDFKNEENDNEHTINLEFNADFVKDIKSVMIDNQVLDVTKYGDDQTIPVNNCLKYLAYQQNYFKLFLKCKNLEPGNHSIKISTTVKNYYFNFKVISLTCIDSSKCRKFTVGVKVCPLINKQLKKSYSINSFNKLNFKHNKNNIYNFLSKKVRGYLYNQEVILSVNAKDKKKIKRIKKYLESQLKHKVIVKDNLVAKNSFNLEFKYKQFKCF